MLLLAAPTNVWPGLFLSVRDLGNTPQPKHCRGLSHLRSAAHLEPQPFALAARHSGAAMPSHSRRNAAASPPPWSVEETDACFIMKDHAGQSLAYVYFEEEPGRYAAAKLLTGDEARRIAANVAKLPELLQHLASEEG